MPEPVVGEEPKLLDQFTKQFEFEVQGRKVRGWYGLTEKYSTTGGYGFELIRHRRAMRRHEKMGFKPHIRLARLVGEIHLDEFPVTNNKMDFVRDTPLWREVEETVGRITREIRGIAGKMASKKMDQKDLAEIDDVRTGVQDVLNSKAFEQTLTRRALDEMLTAQELADDDEPGISVQQGKRSTDGGEPQGMGDRSKTGDRAPRVTHERVRRVKASLATLEIEHNAVSLGGDSPYKIWEIAATNPVLKLVVGTNLDHPMYTEASEDLILWV